MRQYSDLEIYKEIFDTKTIGPITAFMADGKQKQQQRELFEANKIRNPKLTHPNLEDYNPQTLIDLFQSKFELIQDLRPPLRDLYYFAIQKVINVQTILQASKEKDWELFQSTNKKYYGQIDKDVWNYVLKKTNETIKEGGKYKELSEELSFLKENINLSYDKKSAKKIESILQEPLNPELQNSVLDLIQIEIEFPEQREFTPSEIIKIFTKALKLYGIDNWTVEIHPHFEGMTISSSTHTLFTPASKNYERSYLKRLIFHEIGVHILRKELIKKNKQIIISRFRLSQTEEEGLATLVEEVFWDRKDYPTSGFLAVALAAGMDGIQRDFRDLYEIYRRLIKVNNKVEDKQADPHQAAWTRCIKTFMGTDYNTPGVPLYRIKNYLEEGIYTRQLLNNNPEMFDYVMHTGFNYLNPELSKSVLDLKPL